MTAESAQQFRKELERLVERFRRESEKHKRLYRRLRYLIFCLTGCATVLSSLALTFKDAQPWLNIGVVLASVAVSVVTSIEGMRKPSELWILERNLFHGLSDLKREMDVKIGETSAALDLDRCFDRMQLILSQSTEKWTRQFQPAPKEDAQGLSTPGEGTADSGKRANT